ncbi:MAG: Rrf2 family transcriptional regulator [Ruminococcus sp.]|nr:Rrf2 family transcriptional regulator [Ruminococcus sp.]MCD7800643.1 Rrf2 family transcriptional regulator [Ruminococcus sp.]
MKISTKGRYALRIMLDLAIHDKGEYIPIKEVSQRQGVSVKYIEQIITLLSRAGYVKSIRGNHGGYRLSYLPKDYTVGMILRCAEGSIAPVSCLDDEVNQCPRAEICPTLSLWTRLNDAINEIVDNTSLQDMLDECQNIASENYII